MELTKKDFRIKHLIDKIGDDNLFLLSSSVSYYSALALAPFMLILLAVASFLGQDIQFQISQHVKNNFSPEVGKMIGIIFTNMNKEEGVNIGSISGVIGVLVLLWTCSLVFLQFRYALDVIYGQYNANTVKSIWQTIKERFFSMLSVLGGALLVIASFAIAAIVEYFFGPGTKENTVYRFLVILLNFLIYLSIFTGLHYFTPSKKNKFRQAVKTAALSSVFFILGNILLASYLKGVASNSVYGAAGTLLVFLVWSYYSSFTIFLSAEVFLYFKKEK